MRSSSLPESDVRYVHYAPAEDRVESDIYEIVHGGRSGFSGIRFNPGIRRRRRSQLPRQAEAEAEAHIAQVNRDIVLKELMDEDVEMNRGFSIHMIVRKKRVSASADPVVRLNRTIVMEIRASGSFLGL